MNKKYIVPILVLILGIFMHVDSYFIDPPNFLNILGRIVGGGLCGGAVCQMLIIRRENKKISENRISGVNLTKFKLTKQYITVALIFLLSLFLISSAIFVKPIIGIPSLIIGLLSSFYVFFRLFDFAYNENKKKSSLSLFNCTGVYSREREREREREQRERGLYLNNTSATYRPLTDYQDRLRRNRESNYNEDLRMRVIADQMRAASLVTPIIEFQQTPNQTIQTIQTDQANYAQHMNSMQNMIERYRNASDQQTGIPYTPHPNPIIEGYRIRRFAQEGINPSIPAQPESPKPITPANPEVKIIPNVEPPVVIKVQSAIDQLEVE